MQRRCRGSNHSFHNLLAILRFSTMKCTLILAFALFAVVYSVEHYTSEHDDLDINVVINDLKQLEAYHMCFTFNSGCTDITSHFKKDLAEAIEQGCAKCTEAQKHLLKNYLAGLKDKLPDSYEAMKKKYDPHNKHFAALETALA